MVRAWGCIVSTQPLERLETKVSHAGGQPCLCDQTLVRTLDTKTWVCPCLTILHAYCYILLLGEARTIYTTLLGEDN